VWSNVKAFFGFDDAPPTDKRSAVSVLVAQSLKELAVTEDEAIAIKLSLLAMRAGNQDDPNDTVERLAKINPSVKMIHIETEDHGSMLTNEQFRQDLKAFLMSA
jgi:hypothetical protein